ncbi:uncharacterized protein LOC111342816 [Stylophora pistillata]|uniref:uncharacterized protein LOC111342816 n=1 Tax=Stylophora pistillata TaxID=50429 RepID=UPI000C04464D|nr:uncharacterized protein LOC111342816 [Stylophora pistillata]
MLVKQHSIFMNQRTLKRNIMLKDYGLKRRETVDEELKERVRDLILQEICTDPDSLNGYRTMWHVLRLRHRINVPRRLVESLLIREVDPRGVEHRESRCLQRRTYVSPGPNFCWHMDGYDKLKPFGFSIHGCVDGFSRRILWHEVQRSNKNPRSVVSYFIKHVKAAHGCPVRVYTDPGTENGLVAGIQCYLRGEGLDEYAGSKSHKYVSSSKNQRIECQWSHYRKQRLSWWIDFFNDLHESDILDLTSDLQKEAIWFCFADLLQTDLNKVKEYWNSHRIRKSKHAIVSGVPDMMYFLPEDFGHTDCLVSISPHKFTEIENRFEGFDVEDDECNSVFHEYFQHVIDNNGLSNPTSIHEAGVLLRSLLSLQKVNSKFLSFWELVNHFHKGSPVYNGRRH